MKKPLNYLIAAICSASMFAACNDDKVSSPVGETTFNDENGLELTYSGEPMSGKEVHFVPYGDKAVLTLSGVDADLASLMGGLVTLDPVKTSGVVPGETTTTLNVDLTVSGNTVSFEGTDELNGRKLQYRGTADANVMKLDINVEMPQNTWNGTSWKLNHDAPLHIVWDADEFPFADGKWDIQSAILMTMMMMPINGMTIPQLLPAVLNEVSFMPDGNIRANYKDEPSDEAFHDSPLNLASYTVKDNELYVYLNIAQIIETAGKDTTPSSKADVITLLSSVLEGIAPMAANGVHISSETAEDGSTVVYLGSDVLLPILKAVKPAFEDEVFVEALTALILESAGDLAGLAQAFLPPILAALPNVIDTTRDIQIGIKLQDANKSE